MRMLLRYPLVMAGVSLKNISVDRLRLQCMHLGIKMRLSKASLPWEGVQRVRRTIDIRQRVRRKTLRYVATRCMRSPNPLISKCHIDKCLLVWETAEMVHLFSLKFILDSLAVRRVADQRKHRANSLH